MGTDEDKMEERWRDNIERQVASTAACVQKIDRILAVVATNVKGIPKRVREIEEDVAEIKTEARVAKTCAAEAKADKKWLWGVGAAAFGWFVKLVFGN